MLAFNDFWFGLVVRINCFDKILSFRFILGIVPGILVENATSASELCGVAWGVYILDAVEYMVLYSIGVTSVAKYM